MKRFLDFSAALILLGLFFPLLLFIGLLVKCRLGNQVIFTQIRPGLKGKPFKLYKFRSMTNEKDREGRLLPDEQRFTTFSRMLRQTSLDELPELINVLKGDMSLVGPRPLLMEYLPLYNNHQARRHDVLPGITGWAQINGRNSLSWKEKFDLDIWYVDNRNFWLDIWILIATIVKVYKAEGISQKGELTAQPFKGN